MVDTYWAAKQQGKYHTKTDVNNFFKYIQHRNQQISSLLSIYQQLLEINLLTQELVSSAASN